MSTNGTTRRNRNNGTAEAEPVNRLTETVETAYREATRDAAAFYTPTANHEFAVGEYIRTADGNWTILVEQLQWHNSHQLQKSIPAYSGRSLVAGKLTGDPLFIPATDVGGKVEVEPEKTAAQLEAERSAREDADFCGDIPESVAKKAKIRVVCIVNGRERKVTVPGLPAGDGHDDIREHLEKAGLCQWAAPAGGLYMPLDGSDKPKNEAAKTGYCRGSSASKYLASKVRPAM